MPTSIVEFHQLYRALQRASGRQRRVACQAFCQAVIGVQRRGELGILPACALIEGALHSPELQADEEIGRIREQAAALQSPLGSVGPDPVAAWRDLVKHIEQLTP